MTDKLELRPVRQPLVIFVPRLTVVNIPQTTTLLALGFFTAIFFWPIYLALVATRVPEDFREEVISTGKFIRDAMLMIIGFYFAKVVNAGQQETINRALEAARAAPPPPEAPEGEVRRDRDQ